MISPQPAPSAVGEAELAEALSDSPAVVTTASQPAEESHKQREYWIQADSFQLNLVPSGRDDMTGDTYTAAQTTFWAIGYRAYTPHWREPLPGNDSIGPNTGVPGPIFRGSVGDTITVHFRNNDEHYGHPHSLHPHGVRYGPDSDGAYLASQPDRPGTAVMPGQSYKYRWSCPPSSVGTWVYHDHSAAQMVGASQGQHMVMELGAELGLMGMIAITDKDTPRVDREFFVLLHEAWNSDIPELAQNLMCVNGASFVGNTPVFEAAVGNKVRWRVGTLGLLPHVFHLHGHRWHNGIRYVDSEGLAASETLTIEYVEDNPGDWLYHCHFPDHMMMGMVGQYRVTT